MAQSIKQGANLRLLNSILHSEREVPATCVQKHIRSFYTHRYAQGVLSHGSRRSPPIRQYKSPNSTQQKRNFSATRKAQQNDHPSPQQSSVNATEVSHFSALASSWWDPQGSSRLLHLMNPLRHDFINECISKDRSNPHDPHKKYTYLDIGCGGGIFAESAARLPHTTSVTAIDPTPEVLAIAKEHSRNDPSLSSKLTYLNTSIEDLSSHFPPTDPSSTSPITPQFDIISVFEVLEHVTSPSTFLRNVLSHLKPGGFLVGSTISRHPLSYLTTIAIGEMPVFGLVPPATHTWSQYIKPGELQGFFEKEGRREGFGRFEVKGVAYIPGFGWKWVPEGFGLEGVGNYFFGVQKKM